ncbi:MAG: bifunctional homocysteine S-methyltransferase/methylenetetrahydrofolate reductase [Ignavibacteria bacterium]|nr:bifunctional homocysteine S-methyltransferase/methylenetetrahydrofolate reductase [Ignavibacteria bacterium]
MKNFRDKLNNEIIVFDGGTGTYLYEKGIFINRCFEELNLTNPDLVKQVHRDYVLAGADVIETNTFGANRFKLAPHGLNEKIYEINFAGAKLAKEVAGDKVFVAGSVGPLGVQIEPLGKIGYDEAKDFFKEQIQPLIDGGVDLIILETFTLTAEIIQAIRAVKEINPDFPVIAQVTINEEGNLLSGEPIEKFVEQVTQYKPDVIGFNCSVGPKPMLDALERLRELTDLPISIQPNAGYPVNIGGRNIYMTSPEYIAEYSKRFIQTGAAIVGGCCGTNPSHIKAIRRAVQALQPSKRLDIKVEELKVQQPENVYVYKQYEKSRFSNKLLREEFVTLVEIVSPRGVSAKKEIEKARKLYHFGIDAINIPDGPRAMARMSALALAVLIQREVGIETILHFACRDRNVIGMQSDLLGAWALGIRNILAITGDPPKLGNYPDATAVFDVDSIGLVNLLNRLNHGLDLAGNSIGEATGFSIGVGVNPGAINLDEELRRLDWKVQAGAEYMITQPVFDIRILENFMKRVEHYKIPLIVGIWPLVSYRNAEFMNNEVPGASVPSNIMERMRRAQDISKEAAFEEGIKIAKETFDYIRSEVNGVQIAAPLGRIEAVFKMLSDEEFYTM